MKAVEVVCVFLCSVDAIAWTALVSSVAGFCWLAAAGLCILATRLAE